jgi:hypothetical protein
MTKMKIIAKSQVLWCTSVIPATQEAKVDGSQSVANPGQKHKTLSGK